MVYLEHSGSKFWRCEIAADNDCRTITSYGRCGTAGRNMTKDFDAPEKAAEYLDKQEASKRKGGYDDASDPSTTTTATAAATNTNKKRTAAAVTPSPARPSSKKQGLKGHKAPNLTTAAATSVDTGVAGIDAALASRVTVHETLHAKLALVDPSKNSDKYYILQVLVNDNSSSSSSSSSSKPPAAKRTRTSARNKKTTTTTSGPAYYLFTRWGRTGTAGQAKLDGPFSGDEKEEEEAQAAFEKIFHSKTGVKWEQAVPGSQPKKGKYEYLASSSAGGGGDGDEDKGTWYYYLQNDPLGKPNGWYPYDEENSTEVEGLHGEYVAANKPQRLSRRTVTSESNGFQYQVDLQSMTQTNTSSGTVRPIGRTVTGQAPATAPTAAALKPPPPGSRTAAAQQRLFGASSSDDEEEEDAKPSSNIQRQVDAAASRSLQGGTIYQDYDVMLNQTNLGANNNKFYKIQLVETSAGYTLFTKWGRVGEAGQTQEQGPWPDCNHGIKEFGKKFRSKTANKWDDYHADPSSFVSKTGKYTVLEMEHDATTVAAVAAAANNVAPCTLDQATQDLVNLIFDQDMFKSAMSAMKLDPRKLPLGALSQAQIKKGFDVLEKIEQELQSGSSSNRRLTDLTSEFYTVIPHNFGRSRGPVLNTMESVEEKYEMLNTLSDIETAQAMQKNITQSGGGSSTQQQQPHPADLNYEQLAADLTVLNPTKDKKEYSMIQQYFKDTKDDGGYGGPMALRQVWRVNRHDESKRFAKHAQLDNRKLLWHGTNVAVVAAILKSGLRIMPHSGGRVGRGIYLADQHQKSAWYVHAAKGTIIMFLVEAALGKSHEIHRDDPSLTSAPPGFDSVLAMGSSRPAGGDLELEIDGKSVSVPQGKPGAVATAKHSAFAHNEFLVYQESQHRIRYILSFDTRRDDN